MSRPGTSPQRHLRQRSKARGPRPEARRYAGWIITLVIGIAGIAAFLLWPRGPVYAEYVDGVRPTVVFVWSDPTVHHPGG